MTKAKTTAKKTTKAKAIIHTIRPYVHDMGGHGVWVFDDPEKELDKEALVSGTDDVMDHLAAQIPNGREGFELTFSDSPFMGYQLAFEWSRSDDGKGMGESIRGNWYKQKGTDHEAWLCPALFKYFPSAPKNIYAKAGPLTSKLVKGQGHVTVQGRKEK